MLSCSDEPEMRFDWSVTKSIFFSYTDGEMIHGKEISRTTEIYKNQTEDYILSLKRDYESQSNGMYTYRFLYFKKS